MSQRLQVLAVLTYGMGIFPPGYKGLETVATVMKNEYIAHAEVYHAIKEIDKNALVGLAKNTVLFDPYNRYNPFDWFLANMLQRLWSDLFIEFITTGVFAGALPSVSVNGSYPKAKNALDWIGLNYYNQHGVKFTLAKKPFTLTIRDDQIKTGYHMGN